VQRIHPWTMPFAAVAMLWAMALPAAAFARARPSTPWAGRVASAAVYVAGAVVCHQRAERSFALAGVALPVCARCTGIYTAAAAAAASLLTRSRRRSSSRSGLISGHTRALACLAVSPTALTVAYEWSSARATSNIVRLLAGMPIGLLVGWLVMRSARPLAQSE